MSKKEHVFGVTLVRQSKNTPWGLTIVGGADLGTPIIITRIMPGTPAERHLLRGDIIKKIGDYDARDVSHQDANNLFINAGNSIKIDVQRDPRIYGSHGRSTSLLDVTHPSSRPHSSLSTEAPRSETPGLRGTASPRTIVFPPPNPYETEEEASAYAYTPTIEESSEENIVNQPKTEFIRTLEGKMEVANSYRYNRYQQEEESATAWPYRTTPLVLPGAKAKHEKELAPTESYLRHHPNPGMRAPPPQHIFLPQDVLMKQKVADTVIQRVGADETLAGKQVVHKQFNSPIGLYSDANIADTIHHQTGVTPIGPKKTIVYDPAKSETFKALQEDKYGDQIQEVANPVQPRVFTPNAQPVKQKAALQPPQTHTYDPLSRSSASPSHHQPYVNSMGHSDDHIAQSGSFRRLMNMVMGESEF